MVATLFGSFATGLQEPRTLYLRSKPSRRRILLGFSLTGYSSITGSRNPLFPIEDLFSFRDFGQNSANNCRSDPGRLPPIIPALMVLQSVQIKLLRPIFVRIVPISRMIGLTTCLWPSSPLTTSRIPRLSKRRSSPTTALILDSTLSYRRIHPTRTPNLYRIDLLPSTTNSVLNYNRHNNVKNAHTTNERLKDPTSNPET